MSKRGDRHDIDPTAIQPARAHPATLEQSAQTESLSPTGSRNKRRASGSGAADLAMSGPSGAAPAAPLGAEEPSMTSSPMGPPPAKKSRTNTPWTPAEEQRLKTMRDAGNSWADIAKVSCGEVMAGVTQESRLRLLQTFPSRTEGSVKKHWYKVYPLFIINSVLD
jgi:hypothetical protein